MSIGKIAVLAVALVLVSGGIGAALADWNNPEPGPAIDLVDVDARKDDAADVTLASEEEGDGDDTGDGDSAPKKQQQPAQQQAAGDGDDTAGDDGTSGGDNTHAAPAPAQPARAGASDTTDGAAPAAPAPAPAQPGAGGGDDSNTGGDDT